MAAGPVALCETPDDLPQVDRVWPEPALADGGEERRYLVDATILLLSVPVLRRSNVGAARIAVRRSKEENCRHVALELAAASDPARAHGLNRAGWIREAVVERDSVPVRAAVLGIMNDSPEQNVEQARNAFRNDGGEERFVAIDSANSPGHTRSRVAHFGAPAGAVAQSRLAEAARRSLGSDASGWREHDWPETGGGAPMTFLYAIYQWMEAGGANRQLSYVFNEDNYRLTLESAPETGRAVRVRGEIENLTKRLRPMRFQFWVDRGSEVPLPYRVEFQPRSFLRLTFEGANSNLTLKEKS